MTPASGGVRTREVRATPGNDRDPAAKKDPAFGAVLSDVAQDKTADASASERGTRARALAPASTGKPPAATTQDDVGTWLVQLALTAPDANSGVSAEAKTPAKGHGKAGTSTSSDDAPAEVDGLVTPGILAGNLAASALSAATLAAHAAQTVATATSTVESADGHVNGPAQAIDGGTKPIPANAVADVDGDAGFAATQVALIEIAGHVTPTRPVLRAAAQDGTEAQPPAADGDEAGQAKGAPAVPPVDAASPETDTNKTSKDSKASVVARPRDTDLTGAGAGDQAVRQIADAVKALAADATASPDAGTAQASAQKPSPTRSLILQLAPATLGTITVRLHLASGGLSVRLTVENQTTLGLISHARDALQAAIGGAYKLDSLVIHGAEAATPPNAGSHDTKSDGGTLADPRSGGQHRDEGASRRPRSDPRQARAAGDRRADGLFV